MKHCLNANVCICVLSPIKYIYDGRLHLKSLKCTVLEAFLKVLYNKEGSALVGFRFLENASTYPRNQEKHMLLPILAFTECLVPPGTVLDHE